MTDCHRASLWTVVHFTLSLITITAVFVLAGCERPFVEEAEPEIELLSPDLSVVQADREIQLQIRATSRNGVDSMLVNGVPMIAGLEQGEFSRPIRLNHGLNTLVLQAFDRRGEGSTDTLLAVAMPNEMDVAELRLPNPRGGHTATVLPGGKLLVAGGAELPNVPASDAAWLYSGVDLRTAPLEYFMIDARTEHTATSLPDGRVLMIGGSQITEPPTINELVEPVEIFDPDSLRFLPVPVSGDPVRRSGHTAILFQLGRQNQAEFFIYLYGGRGDIQYQPTPRLGIRDDIRVFQFRNDSLVALGPTLGPSIDAVADHISTAIQPQIGTQAQYLVGGSFFVADGISDQVVFQMSLSTGSGIRVFDTSPMNIERSGHAAARMVEGEIIVTGGRTFGFTSAIDDIEIYYSQVRQFFPIATEHGLLQKRWGHTATNWDGARILIIGGYGETGAALQTAEWFIVNRSE